MRERIYFDDELVVDSFCGGGGASEGIRMAIGRDPDVAINHDPEAVAMHKANHPNTEHHCQSIYQVDPADVVLKYKRRVGLAWFSPDCTHHSKARGGKPKQKHIRDLAWVVVHWAERAVWKGERIRIIAIENVEEFQDWCPLDADGQAQKDKKGSEFRRWVKALRKLGYHVDWREMRACDYGAPTIRKRLFIMARCDGQPIVWPEPTHGNGRSLPYRTAAECIDWSLRCPSVFLSKDEGRIVRAKRPLADATLRRIAHGIKKFVIDSSQPFIVNLTHQGAERVEALDEPFKTITGANRGEKALIQPFIAGCGGRAGQSPPRGVDQPYHTTTSKADSCLVAPILAGAGGSEYAGKPKRCDVPLNTITKENHIALVVPYLTEHANASNQRIFPADEPLRTHCAGVKGGHFALCAAHIQRHFGTSIGSDCDEPIGAMTAKNKTSVAACFLAQHNTMPGDGVNAGRPLDAPVSTITASGSQQGLVATSLVKLRGTCQHGQPTDEPLATISAQGQHIGLSSALLVKYYGNEKECHDIESPLGTVTTKDRFGYVEGGLHLPPLADWQIPRARAVADLLRQYGFWDDREFVTFEVGGITLVIADIGIRMFARRELFNAQGFRKDYIIAPIYNDKPMTNTASVRMCGNSVSPPPAAAFLSANIQVMA